MGAALQRRRRNKIYGEPIHIIPFIAYLYILIDILINSLRIIRVCLTSRMQILSEVSAQATRKLPQNKRVLVLGENVVKHP